MMKTSNILELYNQYKIEKAKELLINEEYKISYGLNGSKLVSPETIAIYKKWIEQIKIKQQIVIQILEILGNKIFKLPGGTFIVPEFDDDNMSTEEIVIKEEYI